ncbi:MAG: peptide-methionine (R)-S-oxide reductase MsrB [Steroidobacteraceae bacterium]
MTRNEFLRGLAFGAGALAFDRAARAFERLEKPLAEWRALLEPAAYAVLFEEDTERPFSSPLNEEKRKGMYVCAACFLPLFDSATKFESGTGWPSFFRPIANRVATKRDVKFILLRTEYHCARCGGHQGHIFDDGPPPTGQRWCNNGLALRFVPAGKALPALRS